MAEKKLSQKAQLEIEQLELSNEQTKVNIEQSKLSIEQSKLDLSQRNSAGELEISSVKQEGLRRAVEISSSALSRVTGMISEAKRDDSIRALMDLLISSTKALQKEIDPPAKKTTEMAAV
jgi:hypothetical protein